MRLNWEADTPIFFASCFCVMWFPLHKSEIRCPVAYTAEGRMGTPEELGYALAVLADERNGYLAGVDILCDGGATTGRHFKER